MTKAIYKATAEYELDAKQRPVKHRVSVSGILKHLGVSRSGYHAWKKRIPSDTQKRREEITQKIQEIYEESHQNYGAPKITKELQKANIQISEKTVGNYMRGMGIKAQWVKPFTHTTIHSDFSSQLQNILDEKFNPDLPNAVWVSDITYIWTFEGFVYLTSIMDLYSRKIIAWVLSDNLEASSVVEAVEKAKARRKISNPLVFHTDRGCQYVSDGSIKIVQSKCAMFL
jgi:transposase InsO family protein